MAVYYKFKSAKDYDSILIEGQFISVANLKERIFESKHLGRGKDFDLVVSNAQTDEEYTDVAAMIPKNTSVLIRRIPGCPRMPIVTGIEEVKASEDKVEKLPANDLYTAKFPEEPEWGEFGNDLYAIPEVHPAPSFNPTADFTLGNKVDEDSKIKAFIDTPALDWNRQLQDSGGPGRGFGRGRMLAGRGFGRVGLENRTPPAGYICYRCKIPGHFIQHCPTNGDPSYDIKRVKPPTGIPRSMLMTTPDGSYALPSGAVAVLKPNESAFDKEIEGLPSSRPVTDLPPELRCPLCKEVMKDAVLTSKCCFSSFCDKCIREFIISKSMCVCGATNILADDLLPNKTLRETINRIMETTSSSAENAGSMLQIQDMESARDVPLKRPSPTVLSATTSKDEVKLPHEERSPDVKAGEGTSEVKPVNNIEKKPGTSTEPAEAVAESTIAKETTLQERVSSVEDTQEKQLGNDQAKKRKTKKIRRPVNASDLQWKQFQDFGTEGFSGTSMQPLPYNPYWTGGVPMGMDPYMGSYSGAMPFVGFAPLPFDVSYGGILPQEALGAPGGYSFPFSAPQRDPLGMKMNRGPPVKNREVFDSRKPEPRKKLESERHRDREEHPRERGSSREPGKEAGGVTDLPPSKSKPSRGSEPSRLNHPDRKGRSDSVDVPDRRHGPTREPDRESSRRSPAAPRPEKRSRTSDERAAATETATAEENEETKHADRKHKISVFSRISFPAESRKRKSSSSSEMLDGGKEGHRESARDSSTGGHRGDLQRIGGGDESSEEERHFKRRTSSSSSSRRKEEAEEGRASKGEREKRRRSGY